MITSRDPWHGRGWPYRHDIGDASQTEYALLGTFQVARHAASGRPPYHEAVTALRHDHRSGIPRHLGRDQNAVRPIGAPPTCPQLVQLGEAKLPPSIYHARIGHVPLDHGSGDHDLRLVRDELPRPPPFRLASSARILMTENSGKAASLHSWPSSKFFVELRSPQLTGKRYRLAGLLKLPADELARAHPVSCRTGEAFARFTTWQPIIPTPRSPYTVSGHVWGGRRRHHQRAALVSSKATLATPKRCCSSITTKPRL